MEDSTGGAYNPVPEPATNTRPDIVSMDVIWNKVLQVYVRCHLRGGAVTLLRGVGFASAGSTDSAVPSPLV